MYAVSVLAICLTLGQVLNAEHSAELKACHKELFGTEAIPGAFIPSCDEDGYYAAKQCHGSTGYCWCVTKHGDEVPDTRKGPAESHNVQCEQPEDVTEPALRRCPRDPVCDSPCLHGSYLDDKGCPSCVCKEDEDEGDKMPCPVPQCAHKCRYGYKKNENGCETCNCAERPEGMAGGLEDVGCTEPECELDHCPFGLERDALGCHLCRCADDPCKTKGCSETEICQLERDDPGCFGQLCDVDAVCMVKSLCHHHRSLHDKGGYLEPDRDEMLAAMGLLTPRNRPVDYMPQCTEEGAFEPRQCDHDGEYCWCVDDRGEEITDTRIRMNNIPVGPACEKVDTTAVQMKFKVMHELENLQNEMENLKRAFESHISKWFTVEIEYVTIIQITADPSSGRVMIVETIIMFDGRTDLPTAALHMHERMHHQQLDIPYKNTRLRPDPKSITSSHKYEKPRLPEVGLREGPNHSWVTFCKSHQTAVIVGCALGSMTLIICAAIVIHAAHRRRAFAQFYHKKMSGNYEKNLAFAGDTHRQTSITDDKVAIINYDKAAEARESVA